MSDIPKDYGEGMAAFKEPKRPRWADASLLPDLFEKDDPMYLSPDREQPNPADVSSVEAYSQGVAEGRDLGYEQAIKDIESLGQGEANGNGN